MSYGLAFGEVATPRRPEVLATPWGTRTICANGPAYHLERLVIAPRASVPAHYYPGARSTYFVEHGELAMVRRTDTGATAYERIEAGCLVEIDASRIHGFCGGPTETIAYRVSGASPAALPAETAEEAAARWAALSTTELAASARRPSSFREKYWGTIATIVGGEHAAKRILMRKGARSSMEFHVRKTETYFIESGCLRVGLRTGRAENRSIVLAAGQAFDITPGLMHMRMAIEDTIIVEASTQDDDRDSHLVEDGTRYVHVDIDES